MPRIPTICLFVLFLGMPAAPLVAGQLIMKNGDRITGNIIKIWDKEIYIEPDYADEFSVDQDAVEYFLSDDEFELDLGDGKDVDVRFDGVDEAGKQVVLIGEERMTVPLAQIKELDEVEDYRDWGAHVNLNTTVNRGNTDSLNSKITADYSLKLGDHRHLLELSSSREEQNSVSVKEQELFRYSYNWSFSPRWGFGAVASYESDPIRDLDRRMTVGPAATLNVWDGAKKTFNIQFPLGYQNEKIGGQEENNVIAGWIMRIRYKLGRPDLELYHNNSLTQNIAGRTNTAIKTITGARFEITDLLYVNFEIDFDWESEPAAGAKSEDLSMLVGLGFEFE
jgi:putative salt-induced outer membrane protein YdiY